MGRPIKSDPRSQQLNLRLTVAELARIKKRAEALGVRPVYLARVLVLGDAAKLTIRREPQSITEKLIYAQLSRLGNNLNQLVRHLHQTGDPLPADLEPLLRDIRQILARRCHDDR